MMDITILAKDVATWLIPALPYLAKAGEEAVKEVGKKISGEAFEYAKSLWAKLHPKAEAIPALQEAVKDVVAVPESADRQGQLRVQLEKLLASDADLARELNGILQDAKNAGVNLNVSGDRAVSIVGNVSNSNITTGDHNK